MQNWNLNTFFNKNLHNQRFLCTHVQLQDRVLVICTLLDLYLYIYLYKIITISVNCLSQCQLMNYTHAQSKKNIHFRLCICIVPELVQNLPTNKAIISQVCNYYRVCNWVKEIWRYRCTFATPYITISVHPNNYLFKHLAI